MQEVLRANVTAESKITEEKLILRDRLSVNRTILANERTLLSYIRTALAMFAAGAFAVRFFDALYVQAVGGMLVLAGGVTLLVGLRRYRKMRELIDLWVRTEGRPMVRDD
ncbi:MAG: DUF202 domain-containing protein [Candidatus Methanosuratincola sp.]|jgi:putative membrane protein